MRYILCVIFFSHASYLLAAPSPETNVQIQNFDGPIFLHSPKPNCCPLCKGILTTPLNEDELEKIFESNPENYPRKAIYGNTVVTETNCRKDAQENNSEDKVPNGNMVPYGNSHTGSTTSENSGLLRLESGKLDSGNIYPYSTNDDKNRYSETGYFGNTNNCNIFTGNNPGARAGNTCTGIQQGMSYKGTRDAGSNHNVLGNNYTKTGPFRNSNTGAENTYNTDFARNLYNPVSSENTQTPGNAFYNTPYTSTVSPLSNSLSSYLPINTSTENGCTCFRVPIAVCNQAFTPEDETVLVPQKFSYSLILDGEVAPSVAPSCGQNGPYECKCYCYY